MVKLYDVITWTACETNIVLVDEVDEGRGPGEDVLELGQRGMPWLREAFRIAGLSKVIALSAAYRSEIHVVLGESIT